MSESMDLIQYVSESGGDIKLTPDIVKKYLVSGEGNVTNQELGMFMALCKYQKLNPFLKEAYLIKYGSSPATIVTGKEAFLKRATRSDKYQGHKVGIQVWEDDEKVAWAEVYKEGYACPIRVEVDFEEYVGKKNNGEVNAQWKARPKTMLKKVALVQALREAFPEDVGGLYTEEEGHSVVDVTPEPSKASTVKHGRKEKAEKPSETESKDVKTAFKDLLRAYCGGDMVRMQEVQKELTEYNGNSVDDINDATDKRIGVALNKLKKKIEEEYPKGCTCNPQSCANVGYEDNMPYCSTGAECGFEAVF